VGGFFSKIHREILLKPDDFAKLLVPAVLYTIQNNLQYIAVSNLDAATYQVRVSGTSPTSALDRIVTYPIETPRDCRSTSDPSRKALFTLFIRSHVRDGTVFVIEQVLYQLKILTTALFSVTMLGKQLDSLKWGALVVLVGGVSLVQISGLKAKSEEQTNNLTGLVCVLLACCSSGFAGVYFEKVGVCMARGFMI
jgi:hypothetical protein